MIEKISAERYVMLAIKRDEIFKTLSECCPGSDEWSDANKRFTSLTQAIDTGLDLLGSDRRALFFDYFNKTHKNSLDRYNILTCTPSPIHDKQKCELKIQQIKILTSIINSTDNLILGLQINYPSEFPNELIAEAVGQNSLQSIARFQKNEIDDNEIQKNETDLVEGKNIVECNNIDETTRTKPVLNDSQPNLQ